MDTNSISANLPSWNELRQIAQATLLREEYSRIEGSIRKWETNLNHKARLRQRFKLYALLLNDDNEERSKLIVRQHPNKQDVHQQLEAFCKRHSETPIHIADYCPIPGYATHNEELRSQIYKIRESLSIYLVAPDVKAPFSIMIPGPSSAGKTHLVKCLLRALQVKHKYVKSNLSAENNIASAVTKFFQDLLSFTKSRERVIGFLDEVDTISAGGYAYRHLLVPLESEQLKGVVIFFAGSAANNAVEYFQYLRDLPFGTQGGDFYNRISAFAEIPANLLDDPVERIVQFLTMVRARRSFDLIDGQSLAYIAARKFRNSRELQNLINVILRNSPPGAQTLKIIGQSVEINEYLEQKKLFPHIFELFSDRGVAVRD